VAWILFETNQSQTFLGCHQAERIARSLTEFGDYNIMRDSKNSCFIEFYSYDKDVVKEGNIESFIEVIKERKEEFGIVEVRDYAHAKKFKAKCPKLNDE